MSSRFSGDSGMLRIGVRDFYEENRWQKLGRRLKEEPLIPIGSHQ